MKHHDLVILLIMAAASGCVTAQDVRQIREGRLQALKLDWNSALLARRATKASDLTLTSYAGLIEQQLLLRPLLEPQDEDEGSRFLRLGRDMPHRVIPGGDGSGSLGSVLDGIRISKKLPAKAVLAAKAELASADGACTTELFETLDATQRAVESLPLLPPLDRSNMGPDDRLYRVLTNAEAPSGESAKSLSKLRQLEAAWRAVLGACFVPPTQIANFQAVADRVGAFIVPNGRPLCSGTLMADGIVLTARHCFFPKKAVALQEELIASLVFAPADGSPPLKLDVKQFDTEDSLNDPLMDQILVKVAVTGKPLRPFEQAGSLASFTETKGELLGVTKLFMFGAIPLARALDAVSYPHSIVGSARPGCFAVFKSEQCFTHMCSAMPGTSGASMFTLQENNVLWAGQHTAAEGKELAVYCAGPSSQANLALRANRPEINALLILKQ